ncbi:hypothetical protein K1719_002208 [Acacia pycnantha]|nr:hypothetical protein K1719_002208 [Acacia pycnantha]
MTTSSQNNPNSPLSPNVDPYNPISRSRVGNIDQPPLDFNFRINHAGESNRPGFIPLFSAHHFFPPGSLEASPNFFPPVSTVRPPISTKARTASSAPSTSQTIPPSIRCSYCDKDLSKIFWHPTLPCKHSYCEECLNEISPKLRKHNPQCVACERFL